MMISNNELRELLARKRLVNVCSFPLETLLHLDSLMKCNCLDQFACEVVACGRLPPGCQSRTPPLCGAEGSSSSWRTSTADAGRTNRIPDEVYLLVRSEERRVGKGC